MDLCANHMMWPWASLGVAYGALLFLPLVIAVAAAALYRRLAGKGDPRAGSLRSLALRIPFFIALVQLGMLPFHLRLAADELVQATVMEVERYREHEGGRTFWEYKGHFALPAQEGTLVERLRDPLARSLVAGDTVPVMRSPLFPDRWSSLGAEAHLHTGWIGLAGIVLSFVFGGLYLALRRNSSG